MQKNHEVMQSALSNCHILAVTKIIVQWANTDQ